MRMDGLSLAVMLMGALLCGALNASDGYPGATWPTSSPADAGLESAKIEAARDYALTGGGSGCIIYRGKLVCAWGDQQQRYDLKSTTKSFGATALGVALLDGKAQLSDKAAALHPTFGVPPQENQQTGWLDEITLLHLATHTAGFEKPGGYTSLTFQPGMKWAYSDGGPNWLAECLTLAYGRDMRDVMFERIFEPIGITADDLTWRSNQYRPKEIDGIPRREFGSGISASVDAMARLGYLYLREGIWESKRLLPTDFVRQASQPVKSLRGLPEVAGDMHGNASEHYGLLWWNNGDGSLADVPVDAYWSWGLYDSLIVVIPSCDLVVARAGRSWKRREGAGHYEVLEPFLEPIVAAQQPPMSD